MGALVTVAVDSDSFLMPGIIHYRCRDLTILPYLLSLSFDLKIKYISYIYTQYFLL